MSSDHLDRQPAANEVEREGFENDVEEAKFEHKSNQAQKRDVETAAEEKLPKMQSEHSSEQPAIAWQKLLLIGVGLWFAVFLYSLDQTIVANAIPAITEEFHSTLDAGWYGSAYLLTFSAFQLLFGRLYANFSVKYILLTSIFLFELGSLICAVAPSSNVLIAGGAISGVGAAGVAAGAYIVIGHVFPLRVRPICIASIAMVFAVAAVLGPVLGGIFTTNLTWRWCFWVSLPFGGFAMAVLLLLLPKLSHPENTETCMQKLKGLDLVGFFIFMPAIVCLLLALEWGGSTYAWNDGRIIALFVLFGVLGIAFIAFEHFKAEGASLPLRVATQRSVVASTWNAFCNGAAFFLLSYYIPQWQQVILNESAAKSGVNFLPFVLGVVIMANIAGLIVTKFGYYAPFMILASILTPIGEGLISTWRVGTGSPIRIGYQAFAGLAMGMGQQQPQVVIQAVLPKSDVPTGVSIVILVQTMSGAIFIAVGEAVIQNKLAEGLKKTFPNGGGPDAATLAAKGATMLRTIVPAGQLETVLKIYNDAFTMVFLVAAIMSALTIVGSVCVEWKSVKKNQK